MKVVLAARNVDKIFQYRAFRNCINFLNDAGYFFRIYNDFPDIGNLKNSIKYLFSTFIQTFKKN